MDLIPIDEIIDHCERKMERAPVGSIMYDEHSATRTYLLQLKQFLSLDVPLLRLKRLVAAERDNRILLMDEDMALAMLAGANAIQMMHCRVALYQHGSEDQRAIPYHDAARALLAAGEAVLKGIQNGN